MKLGSLFDGSGGVSFAAQLCGIEPVWASEIEPKTDKQIRKWLANPHSDSAEYKMWGNGVALPCVMYVMEGIAREKEEI